MSFPTGPMHVTAEQWNEIREHYEDPADHDDSPGKDDHLEADYEERVSGGGFENYFDRWDDDPSPYGGTYSEE